MTPKPDAPLRENLEAKELFERCADGDAEAWEHFLKRYRSLLAFLVRQELSRQQNSCINLLKIQHGLIWILPERRLMKAKVDCILVMGQQEPVFAL